MASRFIAPIILMCVAGVMACETPDRIFEPAPWSPPPTVPGERQFFSIEVTPTSRAFVEGDTVRLKAVPIDTMGSEIKVPYTVTFISNTPSVAAVSETGLLTALAGGSSDITVAVVIGSTTKRASFRAYVFGAVSPGAIVLTSGKGGWEPSQAQVKPGGTVEWRVAAGGIPVSLVYLMDERYGIVDSLDLTKGPATRRFESRGLITYCSGACWDPPEWGVIYVR